MLTTDYDKISSELDLEVKENVIDVKFWTDQDVDEEGWNCVGYVVLTLPPRERKTEEW
jgi:hypothetical protein